MLICVVVMVAEPVVVALFENPGVTWANSRPVCSQEEAAAALHQVRAGSVEERAGGGRRTPDPDFVSAVGPTAALTQLTKR